MMDRRNESIPFGPGRVDVSVQSDDEAINQELMRNIRSMVQGFALRFGKPVPPKLRGCCGAPDEDWDAAYASLKKNGQREPGPN